jgi:hypothetical protein
MATRSDKQGGKRGTQSDQDEQRAKSSQDPAEGRRDVGGKSSADANTGDISRGRVPQNTQLSSEEPAEGDRESADE